MQCLCIKGVKHVASESIYHYLDARMEVVHLCYCINIEIESGRLDDAWDLSNGADESLCEMLVPIDNG